MKFRALRKWEDIGNSKNLIFVAQLIEELLFDYSLDTYKPSAMNTSLLCLEALMTIRDVESGAIKKPNIKHVLQELCENFDKDATAQSLLSVNISSIKETLLDPKSDLPELKVTIELLALQLSLDKYRKRNEEILINEVQVSNDLNSIRKLVRTYITTLINLGYHSRYINEISKNFFYYSNEKIHGNGDISKYIELFSNNNKKYKVISKGTKIFREFQDSCKKIKIDILQELPDDLTVTLKEHDYDINKSNECYIIIENIEARDPISAKEAADQKIELIKTLITLFHHKEHPKSSESCIVFNEETKKTKLIRKSINPMHKCYDLNTNIAPQKLNKFIDNFSLESDSFRKFTRSSELHSLALASDSKENQMLNLWISIESIIPEKVNDEISNIEHIICSIIPFLNINYITRLLKKFSKDMIQWDSNTAKRLLRNIPCKKLHEKVAHLLILDEHQEKRNQLDIALKDFHLLRDRFKFLQDMLSTPKTVIQTLDNHQKRLEWQLRRIYRARNLIVHSGHTPSYTEILIENTHDYLDTIMNRLMRLSSDTNDIFSLNQGFKLVQLKYRSYYKELSTKNIQFSKDNINDLLFNKII